jgi:hypothetical protein
VRKRTPSKTRVQQVKWTDLENEITTSENDADFFTSLALDILYPLSEIFRGSGGHTVSRGTARAKLGFNRNALTRPKQRTATATAS